MDILWFNWKCIRHPEAGGAELYTHRIAEGLIKRGHSVSLFTSRPDGLPREENLNGVKIIRSGTRFNPLNNVYIKAKDYWRNNPGFDVVVDEVNTRPFLAPDFVDKPIVCLIHQLAREYWDYKTPFPLSFIGKNFLEERWLRNYRDVKTVAVSESTREDLEGLGFSDVEIVYNGLDEPPLDGVPVKEDVFTCLFVGRWTAPKKPLDAIEAFNNVGGGKLWVLGRGEFESEIKQRSSDNVLVKGFVSDSERKKLMHRAHLLLVPGVREGWCRVVLEANSVGTPALGYDVPGLRDSIKDGLTGLLCEPNPNAMAEKIHELKEDKNLQNKLSKNALDWAGNFSWNESTKKFEEILEDARRK